MTWQEACKESKEGIAIRTVKLCGGFEQTWIAFKDGTCITHPVNNPFNERKAAHPDSYYEGWYPAECLGPVYTNEIEKGLMPLKGSPGYEHAEKHFRDEVKKTMDVHDFRMVTPEDGGLAVVKLNTDTMYDELKELDKFIEECNNDSENGS